MTQKKWKHSFTSKVFNKITNFYLSFIMIIVSPFLGYIIDSYYSESIYFEKSGSLLVFLGFLLTIKHRIIQSLYNYDSYHDEMENTFKIGSVYDLEKNHKKIIQIAREEVLGLWSILIGSLINLFGSFLPLINLCICNT